MLTASVPGQGGVPSLPPGSPWWAYLVLAAIGAIVTITGVVAAVIKPREPAPTPPPAVPPVPEPARHNTEEPPAARAQLDVSYSVLVEHITRLNQQVDKAQDEIAHVREQLRLAVERNHELELQLSTAQASLDRAHDELVALRAQLAAVYRPLHRELPPIPGEVHPPPPRAWRTGDPPAGAGDDQWRGGPR